MSITRVLITSDTHCRTGGELPSSLLELAASSDHVVHAGDSCTRDVLDTLGALAPLTAVRGNVDEPELWSVLPEVAQVEIDGVRIGMIHDAGAEPGRHARLRALVPGCDVLVYGHTHAPEILRDAGGAVVNPGSPTQRRRAPSHTVAWMEIVAGTIELLELVEVA